MKIVAIVLLACFGGAPQALAEAEEVAPGITYEVLKEHDPSLIPGATKIIESIFIMQPGTSIDFPMVFRRRISALRCLVRRKLPWAT